MSKIATKKATKQLQKIFNVLGKFGGVIETNDPGTWWTLDLEVECIENDRKDVQIGIYKNLNGDIIYDPIFFLSLKTDDNDKIIEVEIHSCEETTILGTTIVDSEDFLHGFGNVEKDPHGLKRRFSSFMYGMTELGPYLTKPKKVKKYNETLAD